MSNLRTMNTSDLVTLEGELLFNPQSGDMVRFCLDPGSTGTIVKIISNNLVDVLWSKVERISYPSIPRNINFSEIGRKLFTVEPMPQGALPFYLDHMCKDEKD
jgi:hypothetical protein